MDKRKGAVADGPPLNDGNKRRRMIRSKRRFVRGAPVHTRSYPPRSFFSHCLFSFFDIRLFLWVSMMRQLLLVIARHFNESYLVGRIGGRWFWFFYHQNISHRPSRYPRFFYPQHSSIIGEQFVLDRNPFDLAGVTLPECNGLAPSSHAWLLHASIWKKFAASTPDVPAGSET